MLRRALKGLDIAVHQLAGIRQTSKELAAQAQDYWSRTGAGEDTVSQNAHWRGAGIFDEDERWLALGREHRELYERLSPLSALPPKLPQIVEWGCGGGANAVHFAEIADTFVGVEVSQASLDECARQLKAVNFDAFVPVLIPAADPEVALEQIPPGSCDLFLCTYVVELLPSPEHGPRLMKVAERVLREGGAALVQVKYDLGSWRTRARQWAYARNVAGNVTYRIDAFWRVVEAAGLEPLAVALVPDQPLVYGSRYAYFWCAKPAAATRA